MHALTNLTASVISLNESPSKKEGKFDVAQEAAPARWPQ